MGFCMYFLKSNISSKSLMTLKVRLSAVFGFAKLARVVLDVYLGNVCPFEVRQNWNKAVQFAIQAQVFGQVRFAVPLSAQP